ncbi:MAG: glycosyltransferase family 2 protein [Flavobacteriales bacterium]|nr:glycosyltransferase family 2 protein [Flavobacteriales bacterium]MCB9193630.1 glycosyltransferase family 2 protein [Flavobacteriales bacterium]
MRVSVLIPVFNKATFVKEAVRSVLDGSWKDLEVVAVDDASTDDSLRILEDIGDRRIRIVRHASNLGPAAAANTGIAAARGEYIVRLDADDIAVPERIARQVAFMDAHPDVGASGGWLQLFGDREVTWKFPLSDDDARAGLLFGVPVSQGASIMRREVLERHGLRYDPAWPRVGEDWLFWARLASVGRIANLDEPMTLYRRGANNITRGGDRIANHREILRLLFPLVGLHPTPEQIDTHLMALTYFHEPPDAQAVRRLRAWFDHLLWLNARQGLFPQAAFARTVGTMWDRVYHYLPRYGWGASIAHMKAGGHWPADRILYLLKWRVNALLGRAPS